MSHQTFSRQYISPQSRLQINQSSFNILISISLSFIFAAPAAFAIAPQDRNHQGARERDRATLPITSIQLTASERVAQSRSTSLPWRNPQLVRIIPEAHLVPGTGNLVAVSPNGQFVASAISTDPQEFADSVRVWNWETGETLYTIPGHRPFVTAIAFSPNGQLLATGNYDDKQRLLIIRLWDATTGRRIRTLYRGIAPQFRDGAFYYNANLTFSPDGQTLYSSAATSIVQEWDLATGALRRNLAGYREIVRSLQVSPDGRTLATTHVDGRLSWLDLSTGRLLNSVTGGIDAFQIAFSPDNQAVMGTFTVNATQPAASVYARQIGIWNVRTGALIKAIANRFGEEWLIFSPDHKTFAAADFNRNIRLYDLETQEELTSFNEQSTNIAFSPDGQLLVAATTQGIKIWRAGNAD